ncbi:MAG: selenoneine synthase SenA [Chloroflexota bacterium]
MPTPTLNATAGPLPSLGARQLIASMREFRRRTLDLVADLDDAKMIGPRLPTVNPPLWEIGHVAWFAEYWILRHLKKRPPLLKNGDALYNSTDVAHDTRWELLLPERARTLDYMNEVFERTAEYIDGRTEISADEFYFYFLALLHEGMHAEALAYTRQTLAYAPPKFIDAPAAAARDSGRCAGDVEIPAGIYIIGATPDFPFVFDNEKWAHPVELKTFKIARAPVTNGEFLAFVDAGGYGDAAYWSSEGWRWRQTGGAPQLEKSFANFFNRSIEETTSIDAAKVSLDHPVYWRRQANGRWLQRIYNQELQLNENLPVVHVSWYEAEAFCRWARRRLPSEAEWEAAAALEPNSEGRSRRHFPWGDDAPDATRANLDWRAGGVVPVNAHGAGDSALGCRQMIGNVWEWTVDNFQAYPGFIVDPYKEYSKPWFGTHKVLRGGCWATSSLLIRNTWRNFYTPDRCDVWAGFRTCAQ